MTIVKKDSDEDVICIVRILMDDVFPFVLCISFFDVDIVDGFGAEIARNLLFHVLRARYPG